jgi:hypothetical protein
MVSFLRIREGMVKSDAYGHSGPVYLSRQVHAFRINGVHGGGGGAGLLAIDFGVGQYSIPWSLFMCLQMRSLTAAVIASDMVNLLNDGYKKSRYCFDDTVSACGR